VELKRGHSDRKPISDAKLRATGPGFSKSSAVKPGANSGRDAGLDSLSGDNQLRTSKNPASKGSGGLPAGGGTSAVAKPVALPKAAPPTDLGKCVNCGKPSSTIR